jgi:hypothetical protein
LRIVIEHVAATAVGNLVNYALSDFDFSEPLYWSVLSNIELIRI